MAEVRPIAEIPDPSEGLPAAVSYLRLGCAGCRYVRCFEIDGYDLIEQLNYGQAEDSSGELEPMVTTLGLQGLPHAIVVGGKRKAFGYLECKTGECGHKYEIEEYVNLLTIIDLENQLS